MSEGVLIQPRQWRKLVKVETVWALLSPEQGLHFTHNGEDVYVLPGDYVLDWKGERSLCRARDLWDELTATGYDPLKCEGILGREWRKYMRQEIVEVAHHITGDGAVHEDLWVERKNFEASQGVRRDAEKLIVHRQQYIEELLADGYQWEDSASV